MSDPLQKYKELYRIRWNEDKEFSERFMPQIKKILNETSLPKKITNNVGTEDDLKGHDLTLEQILQIGVRIRRYADPDTGRRYVDYDDFTEDDKERDTMEDDVYFYAYAIPDESGLHSHIIFNHHDFREARKNGLLRQTRKPNKEHGLVWFNCYPIWDIRKHCKIYGESGRIGWKVRRVREYTNPSKYPKTTLKDFSHRTKETKP